MNSENTFIIDTLGSKGDGIAKTDDGLLHIPFALPGEKFTEGPDASLTRVESSQHRRTPPCQYFGICGGCRMQHADDSLIADWKLSLAREQFARFDLTPDLQFIDAHQSGRRRVSLHVRKMDGKISAGFMQAKSHNLVDIISCPLLTPTLQAQSFTIARQLGELLQGAFKAFDVQITQTDTGLDADMRGLGKLDDKTRTRLSQNTEALGLSRLCLHGDILAQSQAPSLRIGKSQVTLPPGGFLQATQQAELIMADAANKSLSGCRKIADLFCGIGPFALRLAEHAAILAADLDAGAIASLTQAARNTSGIKPIKAEKRDLFRMPYLARELTGLDGAIIDPPRAGAEAQMRELAKSSLKKIFSVGCDAQNFARDAAILTNAGWSMSPVTVLDQFRYAPHIELMALFTRKNK